MKLTITKQFQDFIKSVGLSLDEMLQRAEIPNILWKEELNLSPLEYFRFLQELDHVITDEQLLAFSEIRNIHMFMPTFFAALCAKNGLEAVKRFATYKKLMGPLVIPVEELGTTVSIRFSFAYPNQELPRFVLLNEQLILVSLLRMGSGKEIQPERVESPYPYGTKLEEYVGVKVHLSKDNRIVFRRADLMLPFITQNNVMWEYLEPELRKRLAIVSSENSFTGIVEKLLFSAIPSGKFSREDIAKSLGVSVRTLQRNLSAENTTFNQQVQAVQKLLAINYLQKNDLTTTETAYLVGYQDQTAFSRAFKKWTGKTVTEYKALKKSSYAVV